MPTPHQWRFGPFCLETATMHLWDDATPVALPPKAFDVLHYLVTHPDRLVTKEELLNALWPETAVTDAVVRVAIGAIRKALGETAQTSRYIATVSRRGYRFLAPVTREDPPAPPTHEASLRSAAPVAPLPDALRPQAAAPAVVSTTSSPAPSSASLRPPEVSHLTPALALGGERKQVTVLVAEIPTPLALLRDQDAEVVQQLVEPALQAMRDAVQRYGGRVYQARETGLLALFGAPQAYEDHALRACYAALAMQTALRTYAEEVQRAHGWTLQSRIGLHAGEVVLRAHGPDGPREPSLLGPTTVLADALQQGAPPDTIVLSATTARLVAGVTSVTAAGHVTLAGLAEPVEVYTLHGARSRPGRLHMARVRGLTPFVGRQEELAALHRLLPQAAAGHGQLVAVIGEAGVGKSRLVDTFLQRAAAEGWRVLDCVTVSYRQTIPYGPILDLLRQYWHLEEGEDAHTIRQTVTEHIQTLNAALQDVIPALLSLLDALPDDSPFRELDPVQRRQHMLDALKRVLVCESQVQPLLLVCEDLHWIDSETQAVLDSVVESLPTAQILLLVNYRPQYQHRWGSKTYYVQLRLDPLPPMSADAFLHALLGDDASLQPLTPLLIARTEGNPFFLEESVHALVETGVLQGERGAYHLGQALHTIQVPATVQAVLAARIDRLPPEAKRLLQTAAVMGTEVPWPLLHAIADLSEGALHHGLAHLQAAEFLYETRLFPERAFTFKHTLMHEVAYGSLLQERRRVLHARIVEALEGLYLDRVAEQVERLAHHAWRGEVWDKAVAYCWLAGTKAFSRSANLEAVVCFEQALTALRHVPESRETCEQAIDLRSHLGNALVPLGEFRRIFDRLREVEPLAEALADQRRLGRACSFMTYCLYMTGDYEHAVTLGQRALSMALSQFSFEPL